MEKGGAEHWTNNYSVQRRVGRRAEWKIGALSRSSVLLALT